jgi:hypothetical protein
VMPLLRYYLYATCYIAAAFLRDVLGESGE